MPPTPWDIGLNVDPYLMICFLFQAQNELENELQTKHVRNLNLP